MKAFVYILKSEIGSLYIGSTNDLKRRLKQHETGHTQTTRNWKRKDYIEKIVRDGYIKTRL